MVTTKRQVENYLSLRLSQTVNSLNCHPHLVVQRFTGGSYLLLLRGEFGVLQPCGEQSLAHSFQHD